MKHDYRQALSVVRRRTARDTISRLLGLPKWTHQQLARSIHGSPRSKHARRNGRISSREETEREACLRFRSCSGCARRTKICWRASPDCSRLGIASALSTPWRPASRWRYAQSSIIQSSVGHEQRKPRRSQAPRPTPNRHPQPKPQADGRRRARHQASPTARRRDQEISSLGVWLHNDDDLLHRAPQKLDASTRRCSLGR